MGNKYRENIEKLIENQVEKGLHKYGQTLEDNFTLTSDQRIEHLQEELIDGLMYCEHLKAIKDGDGITANDYQRAALRTAQTESFNKEELLLNGLLGLGGESGECFDMVKKAKFQGHVLDVDEMALELGDVLWYVALICYALGFNLSEIMEKNIEKLKKRYPNGFSKERSINREEGTK